MFQSPLRLKSEDDIKRIGESGAVIRELFQSLSSMSLEGLSTWELDSYIDDYILKKKARPAFKTLSDYTYASCISINEEVVHGIPSKKRKITASDILSIDCGAVLHGYFTDACITLAAAAHARAQYSSLIEASRRSLEICISQLYPGSTTGDMGSALQTFLQATPYAVMHQFTGHGVGFALHEAPVVPHYGATSTGIRIKEGMVLAIEPVIKEGSTAVYFKQDGWTAVAEDGKYSSQFEHTVAVTKLGPVVLT